MSCIAGLNGCEAQGRCHYQLSSPPLQACAIYQLTNAFARRMHSSAGGIHQDGKELCAFPTSQEIAGTERVFHSLGRDTQNGVCCFTSVSGAEMIQCIHLN